MMRDIIGFRAALVRILKEYAICGDIPTPPYAVAAFVIDCLVAYGIAIRKSSQMPRAITNDQREGESLDDWMRRHKMLKEA
jgi:hypothetical protein